MVKLVCVSIYIYIYLHIFIYELVKWVEGSLMAQYYQLTFYYKRNVKIKELYYVILKRTILC